MRRRILPSLPLLLALSFGWLSGCAGTGKTPPTPSALPAAAKPPAVPASVPVPVPVSIPAAASAADKAFADGMTALKEGGYERALELFSVAWKEQPGHPGAAQEFDGALIALKKLGDAAFAQGKPEEAGRRWMGTLRYVTHPAVKPREVPFGRGDVQGLLDRLTAGYMEKGLLEYRKGNIEAAIPLWKSILSYDPNHEEAARSIRTASKQLENLKRISPGR